MAQEEQPNVSDKPAFNVNTRKNEIKYIFHTIVDIAEENNKRQGDGQKFEQYWNYSDVQHGFKKKTLHQGILHVNLTKTENAYVTPPCCILGKDDIHIIGLKNRNRAFEGDRVVVKILNTKHWAKDPKKPEGIKPTGRVVYILEFNHSRTSLGYIEKLDINKPVACLGFRPLDPCVPPTVIIQEFLDWQKKQEDSSPFGSMFYTQAQFMQNLLYSVKITSWPVCNAARGKLIGVVGDGHYNLADDRLVALLQRDLSTLIDSYQFRADTYDGKRSRAIQQHFSKLYESKKYFAEEDLLNRTDLTKQAVFTLSPHTRDTDDICVGYSARCLDLGVTELQVHISDVATYLCVGGTGVGLKGAPLKKKPTASKGPSQAVLNITKLLNKIAEETCVSVSTINRRVSSLLPSALRKICCLSPMEKKLAISFEFVIDAQGAIASRRVFASIIQSGVHLTYVHLKKILDSPEDISWLTEELNLGKSKGSATPTISSDQLNELRMCALQFVRASRTLLAASPPRLRLPRPEVKFSLVNDVPRRIHVFYQLTELDDLVAYWSAQVDSSAGSRVARAFPHSALLVREASPDERLVTILRDFLASHDIRVNIPSEPGQLARGLAESFAEIRTRDPTNTNLVPVLLVLCDKILHTPELCTPYRTQSTTATHHFSRDEDHVTQLTSPFHNFTHILAQKQLLMSLKISPAHQDTSLNNAAYMASLANRHNVLRGKIDLMNKRVTEMYLSMQLGYNDHSMNCRAIVVAVYENSVDIMVPSLYFTSTVYLDTYKVSTRMECGLWVHELAWESPAHTQILSNLCILPVSFSRAQHNFSVAVKLRHPLLPGDDGLVKQPLVVKAQGDFEEDRKSFLDQHRIKPADINALCDAPVSVPGIEPKPVVPGTLPDTPSSPALGKLNSVLPPGVGNMKLAAPPAPKTAPRNRRRKSKINKDLDPSKTDSASESGSGSKSWFKANANTAATTPNSRITELLSSEIETLTISSSGESDSESNGNREGGDSNSKTRSANVKDPSRQSVDNPEQPPSTQPTYTGPSDKPSEKESPIKESPIAKSPVNESPIQESPVKVSPIAKMPVNESPIKVSPIGNSSVNESPIKVSPIEESLSARVQSHTPTKQSYSATSVEAPFKQSPISQPYTPTKDRGTREESPMVTTPNRPSPTELHNAPIVRPLLIPDTHYGSPKPVPNVTSPSRSNYGTPVPSNPPGSNPQVDSPSIPSGGFNPPNPSVRPAFVTSSSASSPATSTKNSSAKSPKKEDCVVS